MEKWKSYITNPATIITLIGFVFTIGVIYATRNHRITELEKVQASIDVIGIQTQLSQIQADLQRIKKELQR